MTQIGFFSRRFALLSLPFLIDMFNDEDSSVRLVAVQCVAQLNLLWKMAVDEELLKAFALILRDLDLPVRKFAHEMIRFLLFLLRGLNFTEITQYSYIIDVLVRELSEFSNNSFHITMCMESISQLARNHPIFTQKSIPLYLGLKPPFLPIEGRIDDIIRMIVD
jgi:hypothetical protein